MTVQPFEDGPSVLVADEDGNWRASQAQQIHDGVDGRTVAGAWVYDPDADGGAGAWRAHVDTATNVEVTAESESHHSLYVTWTTLNAAEVDIRLNGVVRHTSSSSSGNYRFTVTPSTEYTVDAVMRTAAGYELTSAPVVLTMPDIPVPANFRVTSVGTNSITYAWDPVSMPNEGAVYRFYNYPAGTPLYDSPVGSPTTWTRTGLASGTQYQVDMLAVWSFSPLVVSGAAGPLSGTTSARFPAGKYHFRPHSAKTYVWGSGYRGDNASSNKIWTGRYNEDGFDSGRRTTMFYNYRDSSGLTPNQRIAQQAAANGQAWTVTKVEVFFERISTSHGYWTPQTAWWNVHNQLDDGTAPTAVSNWESAGSFGLGSSGWVTIPRNDWGIWIINNGNPGMVLGRDDIDVGYMIAPYRVGTVANAIAEIALTVQ